MKRILWAILAVPWSAFGAGVEVRFPGPGIELVGRLYLPEQKAPAPAVVMLHGCSGLWGVRGGEPTRNYDGWAEHFKGRGFAALLVDSFGPRGEREICTQRDRRVTPAAERSRDAHAALRWLAARPDIDPARIHVLGWSNGAQTVLNALRPDAAGRETSGPSFRSGVALYPGCSGLVQTRYRPVAPLLIQAGGADDWTPAAACERLAIDARARGAQVEIDVYEGAHHAFDGIGTRLRHRPEVRNPSSPTGWGAHVGPNPKAREKAVARVTAFLEGSR